MQLQMMQLHFQSWRRKTKQGKGMEKKAMISVPQKFQSIIRKKVWFQFVQNYLKPEAYWIRLIHKSLTWSRLMERAKCAELQAPDCKHTSWFMKRGGMGTSVCQWDWLTRLSPCSCSKVSSRIKARVNRCICSKSNKHLTIHQAVSSCMRFRLQNMTLNSL